jgi:hypothetical protein
MWMFHIVTHFICRRLFWGCGAGTRGAFVRLGQQTDGLSVARINPMSKLTEIQLILQTL